MLPKRDIPRVASTNNANAIFEYNNVHRRTSYLDNGAATNIATAILESSVESSDCRRRE